MTIFMDSPFPPPPPSPTLPKQDRFGLPTQRPSLLSPAEEHTAVEQAVRAVVQEVWAAAVRLLGEADAGRLFKERAAGRRGAPKGSRDRQRDLMMLNLYDAEAAALPKGTKPNLNKLGERLKLAQHCTARAAAVKLRRLLKKRDAETQRRQRHQAKMQRLGLGRTLLGWESDGAK
jgi:hypothetical protein